jgi:aminopeptidase-like protein
MSTPIKDTVVKLWPLHRTLVSDGTDRALEIIGEAFPRSASYAVETYPSGEAAWTWKVPERFVVHEAYLESTDGERFVDWRDNPLHLVSYSLPVDRELSWAELEPHLHHAERRPHAVPWVFKFYERDWGFCLSTDVFRRMPRDTRYRAVIRTEFVTDPAQGLKVGVGVVRPEGWTAASGEALVCAHVCHPSQANDDAAGVATAVEVARRLAATPLPPGSMAVRFLFVPETIGSVCYISRHEDLIPQWRGGIFVECTGNRNILAFQRSRQGDHVMDRVALSVLRRRHGEDFRQGAFFEIVANDEVVINGPGVNVPCISISRVPYDEYHTTDDNPDIIHEDMLAGAADVIEDTLRIFASNYVPRRRFTGPVFLSGHGLWVDYRVNRALSAALEDIMFRFEGDLSIVEIADEVGLDYWTVREYVERFRAKGLIDALPVPDRFDPPHGRRASPRRDMIG